MISNGRKVIGIDENGNISYDRASSCPVSPRKLDGSAQKAVNKETQAAVKRFLLSNTPWFTVTRSTSIQELDADFLKILHEKRIEQLKGANRQFSDDQTDSGLSFGKNNNENKTNLEESTPADDGIIDDENDVDEENGDDKTVDNENADEKDAKLNDASLSKCVTQ